MKLVYIFVLLSIFVEVNAQSPSIKQFQETAHTLLQQGDFVNAVTALQRAREQDPLNIETIKQLSFCYYLQRDFVKGIELGKIAIDLNNTDQQAYQILGMSYKAIADYSAANKMYRAGLKKFPNGGVLYNEYGESLAMDKNTKEAITLWEKGIELDPNYSGNYYNAVKYYHGEKNWIRVLLHGEIFANLDSYSEKTVDVKKSLLDAYKNILTKNSEANQPKSAKITGFEKQLINIYQKTIPQVADGLSIDHISSIRTRLLMEWFPQQAAIYPFQLFNHWQYLLKEGMFEAYNQWLLGDAFNKDAYTLWKANHAHESDLFKVFQQSRVFKIPVGQYYFN